MNLIRILPRETLGDPAHAYDFIDESRLVRRDGTYETEYEKTTWTEYFFGPRLVHRSASVALKLWPGQVRTALGKFSAQLGIGGLPLSPLNPYASDIIICANTQAFCSQAKVDLMNGLHAFGTSVIRAGTTKDTYNAALFLASATRGAADTVYNTTGELAASGNYTQGGIAFTTATAPTLSGTTAIFTPSASLSWAALTSSGAFDCMVMYNATSSTKLALAVFTFGSQSITAGTFTLTMPTNDASNALIRLA